MNNNLATAGKPAIVSSLLQFSLTPLASVLSPHLGSSLVTRASVTSGGLAASRCLVSEPSLCGSTLPRLLGIAWWLNWKAYWLIEDRPFTLRWSASSPCPADFSVHLLFHITKIERMLGKRKCRVKSVLIHTKLRFYPFILPECLTFSEQGTF